MKGRKFMKSIKVFHTHIEVYPYDQGEDIQLERTLSSYDRRTGLYTPLAFYILHDTLYLPRGTNLSYLSTHFHTELTIMPKPDRPSKMSTKINMIADPRNKIQKDAIDFLLSRKQFAADAGLSQLGLTLDTGDGKTYCMVSAITKMNLKTAIFTYTKRIKSQWINTFFTMTDMDHRMLIDVTGSEMLKQIHDKEIVGDIYMINHQTLNSYARKYGWEAIHDLFKVMGIGTKVVDESHYFFENSLRLDFFTDVKRSFYLTATFMRGSAKEKYVFKRAYASVKTFGEETYSYKEKRKHTVCYIVYFHSDPKIRARKKVRTYLGFSSYKYIDYELDEEGILLEVINRVLNRIKNLRGRVLVTSPKIESVDILAKEMEKMTDRSIGTMHSHNKDDVNEENSKKDIISSTVKMMGTGADISQIRVLINTEPIKSRPLVHQLCGRLREFSPTDDTFLFYLVDTTIKETVDMLKIIRPTLEFKCKKVYEVQYDEL